MTALEIFFISAESNYIGIFTTQFFLQNGVKRKGVSNFILRHGRECNIFFENRPKPCPLAVAMPDVDVSGEGPREAVDLLRTWDFLMRGENFAAIRAYEKIGVPIYDMVTAGTFEGGDFNVIEEGCVLIGCGGARTQEEGARQVQSWFEKEGWETRLAFIDEYYVHIDLMVVPIAPKLTAVCLACTEPGIVDWLKAKGHEIIDVPFQDTMALGCNFMSLGGDRVIAPTASKSLIAQLRARGFEVAAVDMSEISKTGGGIHCMAQALKREP